MNSMQGQSHWDNDDYTIAELLNSTPVPEGARRAAHQFLRKAVNRKDSTRLENVVSPAFHPDSIGQTEVGQETESAFSSRTSSKTVSVESARQRLQLNRRSWIVLTVTAASLIAVGLIWWRSHSPMATSQLLTMCIDQLNSEEGWEVFDPNQGSIDASELSSVLRKYLKLSPGEGIETRAVFMASISKAGRLWKLPIPDQNELFVFEFESPRRVGKLNQELQMLSGQSQGWSSAAVHSGERLFVFISKDDLKKTLRTLPLA